MTTQRIIYPNGSGGIAVVVPTPEALETYGIHAIARKDVPAGQPYKIVDISDLPEDRTFRGAWEVDASQLDDGVGAQSNEFPE